jgi:hypothetical protein
MPYFKFKNYKFKAQRKGIYKWIVYNLKGVELFKSGRRKAKIEPGTPKGDSFCKRTNPIYKNRPITEKEKFNRSCWSCKGNKSISNKMFYGKAIEISRSDFYNL